MPIARSTECLMDVAGYMADFPPGAPTITTIKAKAVPKRNVGTPQKLTPGSNYLSE